MNIYHEKQSKQLCALHALNNLFQENAFTKTQMDNICQTLSPNSRFINPHRSPLGLGNYDVNVIMKALQIRDCEMIWFDKRKDPQCLDLQNIKGFILNIPNPSLKKWSSFSSFISLSSNILSSRKHWIAIRSFDDGIYYNLDSKLDSPQVIGNVISKDRNIFIYSYGHPIYFPTYESFILENCQKTAKIRVTVAINIFPEIELISFLKEKNKCIDTEIFVVIKKEAIDEESHITIQ